MIVSKDLRVYITTECDRFKLLAPVSNLVLSITENLRPKTIWLQPYLFTSG